MEDLGREKDLCIFYNCRYRDAFMKCNCKYSIWRRHSYSLFYSNIDWQTATRQHFFFQNIEIFMNTRI